MPLDNAPWSPETTDKPTLDGLIEWLEGQNLNATYNFTDVKDCLVRRFLKATHKWRWFVWIVGPDKWTSHLMTSHRYPSEWNEVAIGWPHTYRAALDRARALRDSQ